MNSWKLFCQLYIWERSLAARGLFEETFDVEMDPMDNRDTFWKSFESFAESKSRHLLALRPKEAAMKSRERECILEKAQLFGRIYQKFGGQWTDFDQAQLVKDVIALQEFEEQKDNVWGSLSKKKKFWRFFVKGKRLGSIHEQLKQVKKNISDAGFDYAAVHKRCKAFEDEDVYECMGQKNPKEIEEAIRDYVDAEDMLAHQQTQKVGRFSSSKEIMEAKKVKKDSESALKKHEVNVKKLKKTCIAEVEAKTEQFMAFIGSQLRATKEEGRSCIEDTAKGYCPEGTSPQSGRQTDLAKGAKWFAIGYYGSYGGGWLLLAVTFAIIGAAAGPAGALAGLAAATAMAQCIPNTAIGTTMFAWNAIGPKECACFPRDCVMDNGTCVMGPGASSNPFGQALPYLSMKCAEVKKGECSLQSCEKRDFQAEHSETVGIFGKVGVVDGGTYNCLASEPRPGKALAVSETLPSGANNTAMNRAKIFQLLNVTMTNSSPPAANH